jgi:hypothetical protein
VRIVRYSAAERGPWDSFVEESKNGTFLMLRDYMEYHADRFLDHSLMIYEDNKLRALLPANQDGERLVSHGGLTYGGIVSTSAMTTPLMLRIFTSLSDYMSGAGIRSWHYKTIPHIYHRYPAEEDLYGLFRVGARLVRRDVLSVVAMPSRLPLQERRRRGVKRAVNEGITYRQTDDFESFWPLLETNLWKFHSVRPVHAVHEITRLHERFRGNIKLYCSFDAGLPVAGVVIYETGQVAHFQYIAVSEEGREKCALDGLIAHLLDEVYAGKSFVDFGISNEAAGTVLNHGLVEQKEGFGARAVVHDFYDVDIPYGKTLT